MRAKRRVGTAPAVTRAAIYVRVSDPKQEREGASLGVQEEQCRAYADRMGYAVAGVYRDVLTGSVLDERPDLSRLRAAIARGEVDRVVVWRTDRLGRDPDHRVYFRVDAQRHGATVESVTDPTDQSREGHLIEYIAGYAAWLERQSLILRTNEGRRKRAASGKLLPGRKALYGYRWRDATRAAYDLDPATAPVVRRIVRDALAGKSLRSIARALGSDGIPSPQGRATWAASTLFDMLTNVLYTGQAVALRRQCHRQPDGSVVVTPRPEGEQIPLPDGTVPALIAPEEFAAIGRRLALNKQRAARNNKQPAETLLRGGIARCGYCGNALVAAKRGDGCGHVYRCSTTNADRHGCPQFCAAAEPFDALVWSRVAYVMSHPEVFAAKRGRAAGADAEAEALADLDRRIGALGERRGRLARAVALLDDDAASAPLLDELRTLAREAERLDAERAEVVARHNARRDTDAALLGLGEWCRRIAANLPKLTYEERRQLLDTLGVSAYLRRGDHPRRWEIVMQPNPHDPGASFVSDSGRGGRGRRR